MPAYEVPAFAVMVWVVLATAVAAVIGVFAALGAVSGYVAGRRAPSSTGRSGAIAGLAIGAVVGVLELVLYGYLAEIATWQLLFLIGVLYVIVGPALFAYRRDSRTSRVVFPVLLTLGVAVVAVSAALGVAIWLTW